MPGRLTLAQIEDLLARAAAEGQDPGHARGLARFVEERIALPRQAREARLAGGQAEEPGRERQPG
jgi:hypothetical protein